MRLIINFSHSLEKNGRRLIGRYEERMSGSLPGFKNKIITETFHWRGKYESLNMKFKI